MPILIQNVLTEEENVAITDFFQNNLSGGWIDATLNDITFDQFPLKKIINIAHNHYDLTSMVGCETWAHFGTRPPWHIDLDELYFNKTGFTKTPLCSIIYYARIRQLKGGKFLTETESIQPIENSLLLFEPRLRHAVEDFQGERVAIAINPWNYKITI
jgi:hypothetical protein